MSDGQQRALRIDARLDPMGATRSTWLRQDVDGSLSIVDEQEGTAGALPADAVMAALRRYGRPLAPEVGLRARSEGRTRLRLSSSGATVSLLAWRTAVDVEPNDYLVLEAPDAEPIAVPARLAAAALRALAAAFSDAG